MSIMGRRELFHLLGVETASGFRGQACVASREVLRVRAFGGQMVGHARGTVMLHLRVPRLVIIGPYLGAPQLVAQNPNTSRLRAAILLGSRATACRYAKSIILLCSWQWNCEFPRGNPNLCPLCT